MSDRTRHNSHNLNVTPRQRNDSVRSYQSHKTGSSLANLSTIQRLGGSIASLALSGTHTDLSSRSYQGLPQKDGEVSQQEEEGDTGLKPKLTLINGITICVGSIIGSGIFIAPGGVLVNTGSVNMAMLVWIISGLFSMIGSYCYAELGCMISKPGGDYAYVHMTFGPFIGFMRLWIECIVVRPCTCTIVALTFSVYVMQPFFPYCENPQSAARCLAAICIITITSLRKDISWAVRNAEDIF
ncbi:unnamed protein product, partial [Meganyctiphanes norvegica]